MLIERVQMEKFVTDIDDRTGVMLKALLAKGFYIVYTGRANLLSRSCLTNYE
ncbi:hypothetical protein GCM10008933_44730 [Paenibacillus motobuensis]|uniref:Uncharacterized protein n=1 Tax=Paenibacillus motobuensis TaxID=295324 RepID=A0ABP3ILP7_9BACL